MAVLIAQKIDLSGKTLTFGSADVAGDVFDNSGSTLLYVKNEDISSHDVTLELQKNIEIEGLSLTITDPVVTVPTTDEKIIGPFPKGWFDDSNGQVNVSYDDITSVTVAVLEI